MAPTFDPRVLWGDTIPASAPVEGPNERCIELPLALDVMQLQRPGRVLDAGCALNGKLSAEMQATVLHLTQNIASEPQYAHSKYALSYVSADLRDLSLFASGAFDRTVCVSTLEHVGFDNAAYLGPTEDCPETVFRAIKELCRVTRTSLFVSVPYADPPAHCAQWRFFHPPAIGHLVRIISNFGFTVHVAFYATTAGGWYGGSDQPVVASPEGFPERVNAIVCLRCTQ